MLAEDPKFLQLEAATAAAQEELNALVWCDHTDPALIEPFEAAHDVKVNLREYEGTGAALALLEQSRLSIAAIKGATHRRKMGPAFGISAALWRVCSSHS